MSQIPLTIFDLVEPRSLHQLYGMLALALDEEVVVEQEASAKEGAPSHLSIILPTKKFRNTSIDYEMTVSPSGCVINDCMKKLALTYHLLLS